MQGKMKGEGDFFFFFPVKRACLCWFIEHLKFCYMLNMAVMMNENGLWIVVRIILIS